MAEPTDPAFINVITNQRMTAADAIIDGSITAAKLASDSVTTVKIVNDAVTFDKIQNISSDRLLGRDTAASGSVEEISLSTALEFTGSQSIRLANTAVTPGSYVSANITVDQQGRLTAAASGTKIILIASGALSDQATLDIAVDSQAWDEVEINLINIIPATDATDLFMRFSQSGSFLSGLSDYQWSQDRGAVVNSDGADSEIHIADNIGTNTNERLVVKINLYRPTASSFIKVAHWSGGQRTSDANELAINGWGELILNSDAIEDIRFLTSSGNLASGYYYAIGKIYAS